MRILEKTSEKLVSRAGETLTETLISLLIVAMASATMFTMTGAANRMIRKSTKSLDGIYEALNAASGQTGTPIDRSVTVHLGEYGSTGASENVDVKLYEGRNADGDTTYTFYSYQVESEVTP